ncbi:unnamed protein product [Rotaria socialis]|uniref:SUEL-type lectin domain-containing protein n=1 Tax=Rotaria socialis TaxID=392032 RepID=A0A817YIV0_9BILA|nr:unnamed protein product [Rotaria socialis]
MVLLMFHRQLLLLFSIFHTTFANVETLHFESACLQQSISVHLNLRCSQYEHIKIIRVIYGYTKQPLFQDCQFSIYDCIQEGTSHNILSCNDQQTCVINLTKSEMLSTAVTTNGVPNCPDFNYIQVNYGCIPDSKDICDQWKDEGPTVHISHTYAKERQFNRCHCKVRSSMPNGQVLLHAREINRQFGSLKSLLLPKSSNNDCKKTTYLEIATDRSERKCMDMLPSTSNSALFGSGSHNFTLTYVKNDLYSELFFYFELKASPIKKDHNVQIICNWKRHSTTTITTTLTTSIITSTIPIKRSRKRTTVEMQNGGKLSRADLIRRRPVNQKIPNDDYMNVEDTTNVLINEDQEEIVQQQDEVEEQEQEEEEEISTTTTMVTTTIKQSKIKKKKTSGSSTVTTRTTTTTTTKLSDDDEEWLRMLSLAADVGSQAPSKQLLSINNRTFVTLTQASIINSDEKLRQTLPKSNTLLFILLIIICVTIFVLIAYCFKVKRPGFMKRLRTNANIAFLFCCEAAKLIFCSSNEARRQSISISNTPNTAIENRSSRRHHHGRNRPSSTLPDYQSSEYYMDEKINDCGTTQNSTSQDSLLNGEHNEYRSNIQNASQNERPPSTTNSKISSKMSTTKSTTNGLRSLHLDEHIKLVKQKKEEAEILRLQKFQEQLRKKEQKWQQQQVERVKKWLQLRNRDGDHRLQVEERRRKREEEARAKIDEILRREKEREQNYQQRVNHNQKTNVVIRPDSAMSVSTDVVSTRRAVSASRIRSNHQDIPNQRAFNDSTDDNSTARDETANRESPQRMPNSNRHHNNDVINRLAKPKIAAMTQSVHVSTATAASSLNGLPVSRSSHQLRLTASSNGRRQIHTRPATVPTSNNESRTSPSDESSRVEHHLSNKQSTNRPTTHSKPSSNTSKPPMASAFSRSKPSTQRSQMTISNSSSSLSSSTIPHKRLIGAASPAKSKPPPSSSSPQPTSTTITTEIQPITNTSEEEIVPVNQEVMSTIESITNDTNDDKVNLIKSEQEQKYIDEQEYQRKLNQKIREAQQRLEIERQREEERQRQLELEEYEREQEQIRLVEEQRRVEQERLQRAIEERVRENELKRQEELRIQQQREELERKQAEETERLNRERQERARKEEEERIERKRRLDLIMRRTRQVSPTAKPENNINKPTIEQTNGHDQINNISSPIAMIKSSIPHSMSDNRFPTSSSTEHFLLNNDSNTLSTLSSTTDTPKFKSPLIQSLLNKARNTRSTDNLSQTSMTASQIMIESMVDESANATKSTTPTDLSDEYHNENSTITITSNGHSDLHLSSSNNLNSFHDRPMEAATAFQ